MRQHVLDMGGLDKLEAAALDEGDIAALQFEFEIEGMKARAEEHRDFAQPTPSSRNSRMRWATKRDCICSSCARTSIGRSSPWRWVNSALVYFSEAREMTSLARSRMPCSER